MYSSAYHSCAVKSESAEKAVLRAEISALNVDTEYANVLVIAEAHEFDAKYKLNVIVCDAPSSVYPEQYHHKRSVHLAAIPQSGCTMSASFPMIPATDPITSCVPAISDALYNARGMYIVFFVVRSFAAISPLLGILTNFAIYSIIKRVSK